MPRTVSCQSARSSRLAVARHHAARPEPVEGRALCSWFDQLTTSGGAGDTRGADFFTGAQMSVSARSSRLAVARHHAARPEPVEGRALCSWFDQLTTSGGACDTRGADFFTGAQMSVSARSSRLAVARHHAARPEPVEGRALGCRPSAIGGLRRASVVRAWGLASWLWLLAKEYRELVASRAWWILLLAMGPLVGVSFSSAVRTYAELSGLNGTAAGVGEAFSPLVGVWAPTFSACELAAAFLLPFVAIRVVAGDRQSGALKIELQHPLSS